MGEISPHFSAPTAQRSRIRSVLAYSLLVIRREGFKVEGNVIHYQYNGSAETGGAVADGICLCPMAESKPAGLSPTYCHCSVGYVKEIFELQFNRKVDVELIDSVLKGGKRCQFKITVI